VALHHDSHVAGHPGRWKTLELVARNYWWPHMSRYIGQYTATCDLCLRTKVLRQPPTGHLESLPTPDTRWDTVSVDFIVELPESDGYDAIMVVVDSLCKRAHFLPVNMTVTAIGSAQQFRDNVWKHHGLPTRILSDSIDCWESKRQRPLRITRKQTARQKESTKNSSSISDCSLVKGKMTGRTFCRWQNSSTTITSTHRHSKPPSSSTPANTHGWALNQNSRLV